jgi:hypothetical protein
MVIAQLALLLIMAATATTIQFGVAVVKEPGGPPQEEKRKAFISRMKKTKRSENI